MTHMFPLHLHPPPPSQSHTYTPCIYNLKRASSLRFVDDIWENSKLKIHNVHSDVSPVIPPPPPPPPPTLPHTYTSYIYNLKRASSLRFVDDIWENSKLKIHNVHSDIHPHPHAPAPATHIHTMQDSSMP